MDDLISRKALKASIEKARKEKYKKFSQLGPGDLERLILVAQPIRNAAAIVRCKDCAHVSETLSVAGSKWCKCLNLLMDEQFYCAYGRKKEVVV